MLNDHGSAEIAPIDEVRLSQLSRDYPIVFFAQLRDKLPRHRNFLRDRVGRVRPFADRQHLPAQRRWSRHQRAARTYGAHRQCHFTSELARCGRALEDGGGSGLPTGIANRINAGYCAGKLGSQLFRGSAIQYGHRA